MTTKKMLALLLAICMVFTILALPVQKAEAAENGMVRVYLSSMNYYSTITSVTITLNGSYAIPSNTALVLQSKGTYTISANGGAIYLSGSGIDTPVNMGSKFTIKQYASDSGSLGTMSFYNPRYGNRSYRGDMTFDISGSGLRLINTVFLEDYIYGVLAGELSNTFPVECLKAQAIIARSYVYNRMISGQSTYEINDTSSDQVYKGYNSSNDVIMNAVDNTAGMLLKYGSSYVSAYFGASNGGQVELPKNAWGTNATSLGCYVMKDDPFDVRNPSSRYANYIISTDPNMLYSSFSQLLASKMYNQLGYSATPTRIVGIALQDPITVDSASVGISRNYQNMRMTVEYDGGQTMDVLFDLHSELKYMLFGADSDLRFFSLSQGGDYYTLTLARYGHGVGMSQRGAQQMANEGYKFNDIIGFYYVGSEIETKTFSRDETTQLPSTTQNPVIGTGVINASSLNVRATASSSGTRIGSLPRNTAVSILGVTDNWYKINYGSTVGYITSEYVLLSAPLQNGGVTTSPTATNTPASTYGTALVTLSMSSSTLNMRASASSSGAVISRLSNGTPLTLLTANPTEQWVKVQTSTGMAGYVSGSYITVTSLNTAAPTPTPTPTPTPATTAVTTKTGVVTLSSSEASLNLRKEASSSSNIITTVPHGSTVTILEELADWYKISYNSFTGYVATGYLKNITTSTTTTTIPSQGTTIVNGVLGGLTDADIPTGGVPGTVVVGAGTTLAIYSDVDKAASLAYLNNGASVTVIGALNDLYFIKSAEGTKGFVLKNYVMTAGNGTTTTTPSTTTPPTTSVTSSTGKIKLSNTSAVLRLRAQPSTTSTIVTTMPHGSAVEITGTSGDWYKIIYMDYTGYVLKSYIQLDTTAAPSTNPTTETPTTPTGTTVYIASIKLSNANSTVNLRKSASSSATILTSIKHGQTVYVLASNDDWYKLVYNNTTGYVLKSYVKLSGETGIMAANGTVTKNSRTTTTTPNTSTSTSTVVGKTGVIKTSDSDSLNVRTGAGTDYAVAFTVSNGSQVLIKADYGTWYGIEVAGKTGYVKATYVSVSGGTSSSSTTTKTSTATVTSPVNLRASGSAKAEKLGSYAKGTEVTVLSKGDTWSKVQVGSKTGYMNNNYLSFK